MTTTDRHPITNLTDWLAGQPPTTHDTLTALGELITGTTDNIARPDTPDTFTLRALGATTYTGIVDETRPLSAVERLTLPLALDELIDEHHPTLGPGDYSNSPPSYTQTTVGETTHRHPNCLRAAFPADTLLPAPVVISIDARDATLSDPEIAIYIADKHQAHATTLLNSLVDRATALNPYRGRAVRAVLTSQGLGLTAITLPTTATRDTVVVPDLVWNEIDLGIAAVRDHHAMLTTHGLGCRRGILLAGPAGTGKSAVSAAIANELVGTFTVIYVEAKAGERLLSAVIDEAERIGGPTLLILEDVDLVVRDRRTGDTAGLAELLHAMDIHPDARILTIASTNDITTLDTAAVRTGRFDTIVDVTYPDTAAATRILTTLTTGIPGTINPATIASRLPDKITGSDLREIVRRAVLAGDGTLTTAALLAEIATGRFRPEVPGPGQYL